MSFSAEVIVMFCFLILHLCLGLESGCWTGTARMDGWTGAFECHICSSDLGSATCVQFWVVCIRDCLSLSLYTSCSGPLSRGFFLVSFAC